jgi:hypothetical protein
MNAIVASGSIQLSMSAKQYFSMAIFVPKLMKGYREKRYLFTMANS